jgi:hypothetical protein
MGDIYSNAVAPVSEASIVEFLREQIVEPLRKPPTKWRNKWFNFRDHYAGHALFKENTETFGTAIYPSKEIAEEKGLWWESTYPLNSKYLGAFEVTE